MTNNIRATCPIIWLLCLSVGSFCLPNSASAANSIKLLPQHIPLIAHLAGYTVGSTTIEEMSRRFGRGFWWTGQHPNGGRTWYNRATRLCIVADGFDYNDRGRIINELEIDYRESPRGAADTDGHPPSTLFAGCVSLGMSRSTVLKLLAHELPPPASSADDLIWHAHGRLTYKTCFSSPGDPYGEDYTSWDADLTFSQGRLVVIDVDCE